MDKIDILTKFYVTKDYENLKENLLYSKKPLELEYLARIYLEEKDYNKAASIYKSINKLYEYGRCQLLLGN